MQKIIATVFLWLMVLSSRAQEAYTLTKPMSEAYLRVAIDAIGQCYWDSSGLNSVRPWDLCGYVLHTIDNEYYEDLATLPYNLLIEAYNVLQPASGLRVPGNPELWTTALITAWLRENPIDLSTQTTFFVDHLEVIVTPRDFNADGINEYFLEVSNSYLYVIYLVIEQNTDGTYNLVNAPLPFHQDIEPSWFESNSYLRELAFDDFNADGLPEWFLVFDGASYWNEGLGTFYLLTWREGGLQSISSEHIPYIYAFETNAANLENTSIDNGIVFENQDDDPPLEIRSVEQSRDNWGCLTTTISWFDWDTNAQLYVRQSDETVVDDTLSCLVGFAESRFWERNYLEAARHYEYALTLPNKNNSDRFFRELRQYVQLRLAQTYLMTEQLDKAQELLGELQTQDMVSKFTETTLATLLEHQNDAPTDICVAFYNLIENVVYYSLYGFDFIDYFRTELVVGFNESLTSPNFMPDPALAGCNIVDEVDALLTIGIFRAPSSTPLDQLSRNGFRIGKSLSSDFNGDGKDDWLVWHEARVPAVLLIANGEGNPFTQSRVYGGHYSRFSAIETFSLPNNSGEAVITFLPTENLGAGWGGLGCPESVKSLGTISVLQYLDDQLKQTHILQWCDNYVDLSSLFGREDGKDVFYSKDESGNTLIYVWDDQTKQYVLPSSESAEVQPITSQSTPSNEELYTGENPSDYYRQIERQLNNALSIERQLTILDNEINAKYMTYSLILQFWKAMILQEAGLDGEALAEFIAIYEAAPDSAYGKFSSLYLGNVP